MKNPFRLPAILALKHIILSIARPLARWIIHPHPVIALTMIASAFAHYEILHLFSDQTRAEIIKDLRDPHNFFLIIPIMVVTGICALIMRRLMFHGGAALKQHHDEELEGNWPMQRVEYLQGLAWFITGIGCLYLWIAKGISNIVKGICIGIMETVQFILVTVPPVVISVLICILQWIHSIKSRIAAFYVLIAMLTGIWFALHYPNLLNIVTVFRIFVPIVVIVSSWQMYHVLDRMGKKHTEHS